MNYIFGPVQSRRLGRSLGIDLFPKKICNLNCVYCEVGRTVAPVVQRGDYSSTRAICAEIDVFCADSTRMDAVDVLTVTAKGEPTLHTGFGDILCHLRAKGKKPVAVLTNGTTLVDATVREALMMADIVVPSLDSARPESFARVDRPSEHFDLAAVIEGLTLFSQAFAGTLWLEVLLVREMNDAPADIEALIAAIRPMRIDRIQLNTVIRPPAEDFAQPLSAERLTAIADLMHAKLQIPVDLPFTTVAAATESGSTGVVMPATSGPATGIMDKIQEMVLRRPCTAAEIDRTFQLGGPDQVEQLLAPLVQSEILQLQEHGGHRYYSQRARRS